MAITSEIWVCRDGGITRAVLLSGKKLLALEVDHEACTPRAGAHYVAKVLRLNAALKIAELDLGDGQTAFLSAPKVKAGELLRVEWVAPAAGTKQAVVKAVAGEATGAPRFLEDGPDAVARLTKAAVAVKTVSAEDFERLDLNARLAALTSRIAAFKGGSLVIDHTEAVTVIDVNGTLAPAALNRAALQEVARQLRLRNISGIVLIDLVGKPDRGLCDVLREATKDDPCRVEVYGLSKLGILELTRERRGWPLSRLLAAAPGLGNSQPE
jgi:Ribonuclease G/E